MMKILSADNMATIPSSSVKAMVKKHFGSDITDDGAEEMARILEEKANKMASFAVKNARTDGRVKVTKKDIAKYLMQEQDFNGK
jgi:histone H3/H4